jgi:predicted DNA-binding transcriptional regulator YafY
MSSHTTLRQISMLKLIPKSPSFILTKLLQQQLAEQGFEVSLRTIQRDLDNLSTIMGLTSSESADGFKWCYVNSTNEILPAILPSEALLLCIAKEQILAQLPIVALNQLEPRFSKAEQTLECSERYKNWRDRVKVVSYGFPLTAMPINEDVRQTVYDAVLNQQQIKLKYQKRPNNEKEYYLNPHGLIIRENTHYLVASKVLSQHDFQLFKFSKMTHAEKLFESNLACTSDIKRYLNSNATGYLLSDTHINLEMLVTGPALSLLEEATLSPNQKITIKELVPERIAKVEVEVEFTQELVHFLLGFGGYVKVLKPAVLIEEFEKRLNINVF